MSASIVFLRLDGCVQRYVAVEFRAVGALAPVIYGAPPAGRRSSTVATARWFDLLTVVFAIRLQLKSFDEASRG